MNNWTEILQILDFAFQPIVNAHTGSTFGFEALLRNVTTAGFSSIDEVFDAAFAQSAQNDQPIPFSRIFFSDMKNIPVSEKTS